jgi:hypothetical protein
VTELLVVIVAALVVIAAATLVGPRLGIAAPLVLVAIGVGASALALTILVRAAYVTPLANLDASQIAIEMRSTLAV